MRDSRRSLGIYLFYSRFPERPGLGLDVFFVQMAVDSETIRFSWLGIPFRTLTRPDVAGVVPCSGWTSGPSVLFRTKHEGYLPIAFGNRRGLNDLRYFGWPIDDPLSWRQFYARLDRQYHPERFQHRPPQPAPDAARPRPSNVLSRFAEYFGLRPGRGDNTDEPND